MTDNPFAVLPLVADQGNRRLLIDLLDDHPDYEPVDLGESLAGTSFDIAILDKRSFSENLDALRDKKAEAAPVLLPYLLLLADVDTEILQADRGELADTVVAESIDEIVSIPIKKAELLWQLGALVRLRQQSLALRNRERELERQVDLFEKAQDIANVGAWEYDVDAEEMWWTDELRHIHALPEDTTLSPERGLQYYHPADRPIIEDAFKAAVEEGEPYDVEVRLIDAEDYHRWVRARGEPQYVDGELTRVRGTVQDITDRKEIERELTRSQELLDHTQQLAETGGWEVDVETGEQRWTDGTYRLHDIPPDSDFDPTVDAGLSFYHPDDRPVIEQAFQRCVEAGNEYDLELRLITAEDRLRWVRAAGTPIRENGEIVRIRGWIRDITDRKEREQELRRIRRAVEASGHAIYITDTEGRIEYVNPAFETITGYSADEAIGETPRILKSGVMAEGYYEELWETLEAGNIWEEIVINRRKNDELYHAHQTIAPVTDTSGEVEAYVAIQTDITERKRLEENLQESLRQLQVIDRVLRHNLHNDMNIIKGYAETIRDSSSGKVAEDATTIVEQSKDLLATVSKERLITELLSDPQPPEPVDIVPLVTGIADDVLDQFPTAQISVDLPDEAIVSTTRNIGQAIEELVQNAIVHSDRDRPRVEVSVSVTEDGIALHVADDGPGIPEMERQILTGETDIQPLYHGSGLGLWLVHLITKRSDGTLAFADNEPRGSIVTIELMQANTPDTGGAHATNAGGADGPR